VKITDVFKLRGPLGELNDQLFGENGEERLAEFNLWLKRVGQLLKRSGTIRVSGAKRFVARGAFGPDNPAGVKFWLNENFKNNFLGKVEEGVPAAELAVQTLTKASRDSLIMDELGDKKETFLSYLYELTGRQPRGEIGDLSVERVYLFYIRDATGKFWAVRADWRSHGREWCVFASPVSGPGEWFSGFRVVSQV